MKSPKEISLEKKILEDTPETSHARTVLEILIQDTEVQHLQEYANTVSLVRLGYNDHGPVHMRMATRNAVRIMNLLHESEIKTSLEQENAGTFDDSLSAVILAAFLHDLGMSMGRQDHELFSMTLALPVIDRILREVFPDREDKRMIIRSLALEGIIGHMASRRIHSLEAGVILIADGCDMEKGRARIPLVLNTEPRAGDIHKYSANSIEKVGIYRGETKPVKIAVEMSSDVGFFQIEEILLPKLNMSPVKPYVELHAGISGGDLKKYV